MDDSKDFLKTLGKNVIYTYAGKVITALFSSFIFIYLCRRLTVTEYGLYSFLLVVLTFFAFFLPLGFPSSILRFIPELIERRELNDATCIIKKCLSIILGVSTIFFILNFLIGKRISGLLSNLNLQIYFPILIIIGISAAQITVLQNVASSLFLQNYNTIYVSIAAIIEFLLIILFMRHGYGLYGVITAMAISNILLLTLYFNKISNILFTKSLNIKIKFDFIRRFLRFALKEFLFRAMAFFWDISIDIYIITYLLGSTAAGLFGFASFITVFLMNWLPGIALLNLIIPLFVKMYTKNNSNERINYLFRFYNKFKAFFIFPVIIGMWLLIDKIIVYIFQEKFLPAAGTFRILLIFLMLQSFLRPMNNIFTILEKNEIPVYANIVIIYRIFASFLLIKYFGIQGAAWGFGSSILIIFLIQYIWLKRILYINLPYLDFLKIAFNSFVMGIAIFFLREKVTDLFSLILVIISGIVIYLVMAYLNKSFEASERSLLNSVIGIKIWHF